MVTYAPEPSPALPAGSQQQLFIARAAVQPQAPVQADVVVRSGPLAVTAVAPHQLTCEVAAAWSRLFSEQPAPSNPFLSMAWVLGWYEAFVTPEDRLVLVVQRELPEGGLGEVVAVAPMHLHRSRLGPATVARRLLPVGAGLGPTAYEIPGFLCQAGQAVQSARALAAACLELPAHWSELALNPEQGWFDEQWAEGSPAPMAFVESVRPRACVVLPLQSTWEETRSGLKRNIKESIRRSANRLAKDERAVRVVRRGEDLDGAAVERFLDLHQARASLERSAERHHPDAYSDPANRGLVRHTLPLLAREGLASMFELYLDGEHVASQLALHAPATSYVHSSGFREDTWSLGVVTHLQAELVRYAIERGDTMVNFSPGPNVSKTRWSEVLWVTHEFAFGAGPRSLVPRLAGFRGLSALRATLTSAARRRSTLGAGSAPVAAAEGARVEPNARAAAA